MSLPEFKMVEFQPKYVIKEITDDDLKAMISVEDHALAEWRRIMLSAAVGEITFTCNQRHRHATYSGCVFCDEMNR